MRKLSLSDQYRQESAEDEASGRSRWMVSYADFMTLLMVFFVALYAIQSKREVPKEVIVTEPAVASEVKVPSGALIASKIQSALTKAQLSEFVKVTERAGVVELSISEGVLFGSGQAQLDEVAQALLAQVAQLLQPHKGGIRVEGHTDSLPISSAVYPSNWELSAARAAAVVRIFQVNGLDARKLSATGLADTRPVDESGTPEGYAANRRVSLVLLND